MNKNPEKQWARSRPGGICRGREQRGFLKQWPHITGVRREHQATSVKMAVVSAKLCARPVSGTQTLPSKPTVSAGDHQVALLLDVVHSRWDVALAQRDTMSGRLPGGEQQGRAPREGRGAFLIFPVYGFGRSAHGSHSKRAGRVRRWLAPLRTCCPPPVVPSLRALVSFRF